MKNEEIVDSFEKEKEEEEKKGILIIKYWPYLLTFTILLFFCVFGMTYSIYKGEGSGDNVIDTGEIVFSYSDVGRGGSGINIENAVPIPDSRGKNMMGKGEYFDFSVTATSEKSLLRYEILVEKNKISTLDNTKVRIYLTALYGGYEQLLVLKDFSGLNTKNVNGKHYYVLYEKTLPAGIKNYSDAYRLRMWVKNSSKDYDDQAFSISVDVNAYQVEE